MTTHHPSEATLLAYVAGTLPAPHSIVVRTHLALCGVCRGMVRLGTPDDMANMIVFFASDAASYISGETISVCGGPNIGGIDLK